MEMTDNHEWILQYALHVFYRRINLIAGNMKIANFEMEENNSANCNSSQKSNVQSPMIGYIFLKKI